MRRALAIVGLLLAALLTLQSVALAAPNTVPDPGLAAFTHGGNACRPNPRPPIGPPTIQVTSPTSKQHVASPLVITGQAIAFEAQFGVALYDQNGNLLAQGPAYTSEGQTLAPFTAALSYRVAVEQNGCLWLFNDSGRDGSPINIVQVPLRLLASTGSCFAEVAPVCIEDRFQQYWVANGGLYQFGFPLAQARIELAEDGRNYAVQYFERARFEYHPENAGTPYEVLLGLLGNTVTADRRGEEPFRPRPRPVGCAPSAAQCPVGQGVWFSATGHYLGLAMGGMGGAASVAIAAQWATKGGLAVYGYPISAVFTERGYDGNIYYLQYFERHRLEYHPENAGTIYVVLLGQLGRQIYESRYSSE